MLCETAWNYCFYNFSHESTGSVKVMNYCNETHLFTSLSKLSTVNNYKSFNDYVLVGLIRVGLVYSTVQIVVGHYLKYATTWSNCSVGSGLWWGGWNYLATVLWCYSNINNRFVHDQFPRYRHRNPGCQGLAAVSRLFGTLLIAVPMLRPTRSGDPWYFLWQETS